MFIDESKTLRAMPGQSRKGAQSNMLYLRVRESILRDLITGNYVSGQKYLTETELAQKLKVCRNTVRKAVSGLEREGYLSRHRRVGTIVRSPRPAAKAPTEGSTEVATRQRLILVLPKWNDSVEGFYTGKLLQAISSPQLEPRFSLEVRHYNDPVRKIETEDTPVVIIDPDIAFYWDLLEMAKAGRRIIVIEPRQPMHGMVNLYSDKRGVVCDAVKKLYQMGHQAVGIINHCLNHLDFERALLGYIDAHRELDRPIPTHGILQMSASGSAPMVPDVRSVSAWICTFLGSFNYVAQQARQEGLSIPDDVSLLSLDDPGDVVVASVGCKVSVAASDPAAAAAMIHNYVNDWRDDRRGTMTYIPTVWIDRESIRPPRPR
ncbi:MAG: GntR family transcriptional regulator [Planctomycetes bacterium]|nr:GntR family transcriptional regulator [Planctomycetota bacterium]